ncbi:MAG: hypothetical protein K0S67_4 [Nitrososphaeraceae archaeon]|jgi:hypothetical protein|nr:hypothetical protein [Nitrososphaeraceae archaeon]
MYYGGNDIYGNPAGYNANVIYEDVFTNNLTAEQISVGEYNTTPLYTLPTTAPPSTPSVMVAQEAGSNVFRIPSVTFKWQLQVTSGTFYDVNVPVAAGDYNLETDIFPLIQDEFQDVLAPLTASGVYTCTLVGGKFTLTLASGVNISQTVMLSAALSDNEYLGSSGNSIIIGNSGSVTVLNDPMYTVIVDPLMIWLPYNNGGEGDVINPMDQNLDANNFSIKKLGYINLLKAGTPSVPVNPEVTVFMDINGNISSVDSAGNEQHLNQTRIQSLDGTDSIFCNSSGNIVYSATTNDFSSSGSMKFPRTITANTSDRTFSFSAGTKLFELSNTSPYLLFDDGATRMRVNNTNTVMYGPNGTSGIEVSNTNSTINGTLVVTDKITTNTNPVNYGLFTSVTDDTVSNTTTETTLISVPLGNYTIPANTIAVGDTYRFRFGGRQTVGSSNIRFRIRSTTGGITGAVLLDSGSIVSVVGDWSVEGIMTFKAIGAAGVAICNSDSTVLRGQTTNACSLVNNTTANTTVDNIISFTVEYAATGNTIIRRNAIFCKVF